MLKAHFRPIMSTARPQKNAPAVRPAEKQVKMSVKMGRGRASASWSVAVGLGGEMVRTDWSGQRR